MGLSAVTILAQFALEEDNNVASQALVADDACLSAGNCALSFLQSRGSQRYPFVMAEVGSESAIAEDTRYVFSAKKVLVHHPDFSWNVTGSSSCPSPLKSIS